MRQRARPRQGGIWSTATNILSWIVTAMAGLLVAGFLLVLDLNRGGPPGQGEETVVVIPRGTGISAISGKLQDYGVIRNVLTFRAGVLMYAHGRHLKAGEYAFPSRSSVRSVVERMAEGRAVLHPVTVPEGWTSDMVVDALASAPFLVGPTPPAPPEGALLPETYETQRGTTREAVLKHMIDAQAELLDRLWPERAPDTPLKTPEEAIILASIVEKETGLASERPEVAAVFINRLKRGMRLESDPTIIYGVSKGRPLGRGILLSELNATTAYNTYKIDGLPPTPIANPGRAAIEAVLNPPKTDALYFVADGGGGHVFAATLSEHRKNVARWRAIEKSRARN